MKKPILVAEKIDKSFGITHAVNHVSLSVDAGEIRGLIGENGSGKSTFCSLLCGIYPMDSGTFFLNGTKLDIHNQVEGNRQGVSIIVQEMGTLAGLTVAENIFLGNEGRFVKRGIKNTGAMNREAQSLLNAHGFDRIKASMMIDAHNFEDRKLIEIVKATYFKPKVVVVDETTTALSQYGREKLYGIMKSIRDDGRTVIFISHDLVEVLSHTDTISVLRDGELIDTVKSSDVSEEDLKRLMVGRELGTRYYRTDYGKPLSDEIVMSVSDVSVPGQLQDITFALRRGEILGIGGLSECGMHELGKAVFGASFDREGSVTLANGTKVDSIPDAIKHSVAYASKDRDNEALIINDSIRDNIVLPSIDELSCKGFLNYRKLNSFAVENAQHMSIKMTGVGQFVSDLSGGNKQKVVLARWLGKGSDIIVLDSPTRGIDVKVKADIYALMNELKSQNKSIIMISEEIQELLGMADRILIMKDGKINGEFHRDKTLGEEDLIAKMV
ncbi:MAG: sugar ABC transporter ATP-binding protein [Eubacteriales bacterium]|jgi:ribose transport system ATP-binding protein|nr:sugar ABC transporter ATP-binding protein [Eubacteriales bacterium]MDD4711200.1 sugar ABC transporter ATP-binding protein [Eubacteriales bacterium]